MVTDSRVSADVGGEAVEVVSA